MGQMANPLQNFSANPLLPLFGKKVVELHVNLAPNTVFAKGTILGCIANSANDVQTATITGTPAGGTFTLSGVNPLTGIAFTTAALAYNAAASAVQTELAKAFGTGNVTVSGSAGGPYTITFGSALGNQPVQAMTAANAFTGGSSPAIAVVHTTTGRTAATYGAYASGNSDGTQNARAIMKFDCATDAAGNITMGPSAIGGPWGETRISIEVYFGGYFDVTQLVGLDGTAVTGLGKIISGSVSGPGILDVV